MQRCHSASLWRGAAPVDPNMLFHMCSCPGVLSNFVPCRGASKLRSGELLRLGLLMALTMTLHNLPEGMAVGFSAFTSFGPIMAAAIAVHNIPEGVIVAAPVFAATGEEELLMGAGR